MKKGKVLGLILLTIFLATQVVPVANANASGVTTTAVTFSDIQNHWAKNTIQWGAGQAIILGFPDGTFRPDATVTEAQFLTMLIRTFTQTGSAKAGEMWYKPYYDFAKVHNYPVANRPDNVILRSKVAEIIAGTQGVNYTGNNAIQYLLGKGLSKGTDPNEITIANYQGGKTLTRAEALQFIKNLKDQGINEIKAMPTSPSPVSELPPVSKPKVSGSVYKINIENGKYETNYNKDLYDYIWNCTASIGKPGDVITIGTKDNKPLSFVCTNHPELNTMTSYGFTQDMTEAGDYFFVKGKFYSIPITKGMVLMYDVYDGSTLVDKLEFDL